MAVARAHLRTHATDARAVNAPARTPRAARAADLAYWEWGEPEGPPVLLAHATGFHARCWDAVVRELNPAQRVIAVDMRGHGASTKQGPFDWDQFGTDVARFAEALALRDIIGVGHSFGGHAITAAAASHPARFARLLLVDPVILSPERYASFTPVNDHPVARRRNEWASAEQMFDRFADRHPFRLWRRDVLMDYCRHGLVPTAGGFALACPPSIEAAIYKGSGKRDIGEAIASLPHPVTVLRARLPRSPGDESSHVQRGAPRAPMDFSASPTWPGLAAAFPNGRDVYLPELTHFIPMQRPDLVAAHINELLKAEGRGG